MAFKPLQFTYTPPPTVPLPPATAGAQAPSVAQASGIGADGTPIAGAEARKLVRRLQDLSATAQYLAQIIGERCASIAIAVDPAQHPQVSQALGRIYAGNTPPGISVAMYRRLVDAQMGMLRADMALGAAGANSPYKVAPVARADVQTVVDHFETQLVQRNDFLSQLVPVIRGLGGEQVAFDHMAASFGQYPGANGVVPAAAPAGLNATLVASASPSGSSSFVDPANATVDVSPALAQGTHQRLDAWQTYYGATYDLTAGIDGVFMDIQSINQKFIVQPVALLMKVVAMLMALMALFHKPSLDSIRKSLVWLVLPRLMGEVTGLTSMLDRLIQKAVSPALQVVNSLGRLFSEIARDTREVAFLVDGGLTGMVRQQVTGKAQRQPPTPAMVKELNTIPKSLGQVTAHVTWAVNQVRLEGQFAQRSMFRVMDRSLGGSGGRLEALQSMRALTALITISTSIINQLNSMTGGALGPQPSQTTGQLGMLVNSINQTGQQSMALSGNNLVLAAPNLTAPPPNVQAVLVAGGSTQIGAPSLYTVPMLNT